MKNTPIVVDSSSLLHRAKNTIGTQLSYNDAASGVIFGFFWQIFKIAKQYETMNFIFAFDSKKSLRKKIFPGYKLSRKREKTEEEIELDKICFEQFDVVKSYLKKIGFANVKQIKGLEADDVIASYLLNNDLSEAILVSGDNDFYQLLDHMKGMLSLATGKIYAKKDLFAEWGCTPDEWRSAKKLAGCTGDSVPGISGIGYKTALQFIHNELPVKSKKYLTIMDGIADKNLMKLTEKLVVLPFPKTPTLKVTKNDLDIDPFMELCESYNFLTFLDNPKNFRDWKALFEGKYTNEQKPEGKSVRKRSVQRTKSLGF